MDPKTLLELAKQHGTPLVVVTIRRCEKTTSNSERCCARAGLLFGQGQ